MRWVLAYDDGRFAGPFGPTYNRMRAMAWRTAKEAEESGSRMAFCDGAVTIALTPEEAEAWEARR